MYDVTRVVSYVEFDMDHVFPKIKKKLLFKIKISLQRPFFKKSKSGIKLTVNTRIVFFRNYFFPLIFNEGK